MIAYDKKLKLYKKEEDMYANNKKCENKVTEHFKNLNIEDKQYDGLSYVQIARNVQKLHFGSESIGKKIRTIFFLK